MRLGGDVATGGLVVGIWERDAEDAAFEVLISKSLEPAEEAAGLGESTAALASLTGATGVGAGPPRRAKRFKRILECKLDHKHITFSASLSEESSPDMVAEGEVDRADLAIVVTHAAVQVSPLISHGRVLSDEWMFCRTTSLHSHRHLLNHGPHRSCVGSTVNVQGQPV